MKSLKKLLVLLGSAAAMSAFGCYRPAGRLFRVPHLLPLPGAAGRSDRGHGGCLERCDGLDGHRGGSPGFGGSSEDGRSGLVGRSRMRRGGKGQAPEATYLGDDQVLGGDGSQKGEPHDM